MLVFCPSVKGAFKKSKSRIKGKQLFITFNYLLIPESQTWQYTGLQFFFIYLNLI